MTFEIKQKTLVKVKIYGEEFELRKPTVGQIENLESAQLSKPESKKGSKVYDNIVNLLDTLGLPKEFSKDMEIDHLNKLLDYLTTQFNSDDSKKK